MKVLGMKGKNSIIEVTEKELETIRTALSEWQGVEDCTSKPAKEFGRLLNKVCSEVQKYEQLPFLKHKKVKHGKATKLLSMVRTPANEG